MSCITRSRWGRAAATARTSLGIAVFAASVASGQAQDTVPGVGTALSAGFVGQLASTDNKPIAGAGVTGAVEMVTRWDLVLRAEIGIARFFGRRSLSRENCGLIAPECGQETAPRLLHATAAWVVRPLPRTRKAYLLLGAGFYRASGTWNDNFISSIGYNAGVGWGLRALGAGAAVEARYHWMASDIGLTRGVFPVVLTYRF